MMKRALGASTVLRKAAVSASCLLTLTCSDQAVKPPQQADRFVDCQATSAVHTGFATYYTWANGGGNCMFDPTPNDLMVAALNPVDYAGSSACGACMSITGPRGEVTVRVVDQCGDCPQGNVDLSPQAFDRIADRAQGRVAIRWRYVPCPVQGTIVYHFKEGSNPWWTAVQIRNHRNPVVRLEYRTPQGVFRTVSRMEYNYFVETNGMGPGPYTFRVRDVFGNVLVDNNIPHTPNGSVAGAGQFPPCPSSP